MLEEIIKKLITVVMLIMASACVAVAEEANSPNFDPFAGGTTPATLAADSNKSDSGPIIPQVEFNNNDISMAFQIISDATGWSLFPTAEVSKAKINLWAKNISAQQLLDTVITMAGFVYHRDGGVITVMTYDEYMQYHGLAKRVFELKFANAVSVDAAVKPFLTKLGKSVVHKETNTIVIYEADANLEFIEAVIKKLDSPSENIITEVINLKYADCENIAKILQSVFSGREKDLRNKSILAAADANEKLQSATDSHVVNLSDESMGIYAVMPANQLVIVGTSADVEKVKCLVSMIDVYSDNMVLEVMDLKYADSELLAEKLRQLFTEEKIKIQGIRKEGQNTETGDSKTAAANTQISPVENILSPRSGVYIQALGRTNQLIIKAYRADIERLKQLIDKLDGYVEPVTQNYQLTYIDASEIFTGLEKILNLDIANTRSKESRDKSQGITLIGKTNSILLTGPPSAHRIMASIVEKIDKPSTYETGMIRIYKLENADVGEVAKTISELLEADSKKKENSSEVNFSQKNASTAQTPSAGGLAQSEEFVPQIEARVSVSKSTNSVVVQATARQHRELEKLIKELDTRRKQVLIKAMIVELTTTDNLNLGVDLSHAADDIAAFTSFGLSTNLNPTTGTRDITVSSGGTAAVLRPDKVEAIIQALKRDGKARITSAPRILVNDNATGFINSIAEEPTTQTNQGQTTTITSFSGFVEAGTQFSIIPHISENGYLRVEYKITLNSFGTKSTDPSIPPPRSTSSIQSEATVPDGFTIVVGGLQAADESEDVDKVPLLGDVPVLQWAFKNTKIEKQYKTTYLFITPNIMESENFTDLKQVSDSALKEIETDGTKKETENADANAPQ